MKKALIVGAAGFVGGYLIDCLRDEFGYEVYGTKLSNQEYENKNATIVDLDILKKSEIDSLLNKIRPDYIFHLAAQSSVAVSWKNPQLTIDINIKGAVNLLDSIKELDYKPRVVMVGSSEEYGHLPAGTEVVKEETVLHPGNVYAATKACQNMISTVYAKAYGMEIILVRAFNHIGPGQLETFVVSDFCKQVVEIEKGIKEPVIFVGNLNAERDFTDVRDVVRAYALLAEKGKSGETYNVGSGRAIKIQTILDKIIAKSERKITVEVDQNKLRPVETPKIEADITKISNDCGWKAVLSIDDTIVDVLNWWRGGKDLIH